MNSYVLDASAILRFTDREAGFNRIGDLLKRATKGEVELLMSAVNWAEVVLTIHKRASSSHVPWNPALLVAGLAALPISIVSVDQPAAEAAAMFKNNFRVPLADAFAGSLALSLSQPTGSTRRPTILLTADSDFKSVAASVMKIEYLPAK